MHDAPKPADSHQRDLVHAVGEVLRVFAPLILVICGLGLGVLSLTSEQITRYSNAYSGNLGTGNATVDLPAVEPGFLQITDTNAACDFRVYPATDSQSVLFNQTGTLPSSWIGCTNRTTTVSGRYTHLILVNGGPSSIAYEVSVWAYSIRTPYAWLALPAGAIALVGLLTFLPRMLAGEILKMREDFERKEEGRKERK